MDSTVYFATNRVISATSGFTVNDFTNQITDPDNPLALSFGSSYIKGLNTGNPDSGSVYSISGLNKGQFDNPTKLAISNSEKNILIFIHGFDNSFSNALTIGAYNSLWFEGAGFPNIPIIFSWPSAGAGISFPFPSGYYFKDKFMSWKSGLALMYFFAELEPIIKSRSYNLNTILLAHSLGTHILESGVEDWFGQGQGTDYLFDWSLLCAGDTSYDCFRQPNQLGLASLTDLSRKVLTLYSHDDLVLSLAQFLNEDAQRLGQDGPLDWRIEPKYKTDPYYLLDCSQFKDYDFNAISSHKYYNRSKNLLNILINEYLNVPKGPPSPSIQGKVK